MPPVATPKTSAGYEQRSNTLSFGLAALGLSLDTIQKRRLLDYLGLLEKWNAVYNLTAVRDPSEMLSVHLLDSLALVPLVKSLRIRHLLDVGSGAGLPGIPIAIALPDIEVDLVDAVQQKVAFQTQVKAELGLANVTPHHARVEALTLTNRPDGIISRAFSELSQMVKLAGPLLAKGGYLVAMKGVRPEQEIAALVTGWKVREVVDLHVPGLAAQRCAVVVTPA